MGGAGSAEGPTLVDFNEKYVKSCGGVASAVRAKWEMPPSYYRLQGFGICPSHVGEGMLQKRCHPPSPVLSFSLV